MVPVGVEGEKAPLRARVVAYGVPALILMAVVFDAEMWPISSFQLFSFSRTAVQRSWELVAVVPGPAGTDHEEVVDLSSVRPELRNHLFPRVTAADAGTAAVLVRPLLVSGGLVPTDVKLVRVYALGIGLGPTKRGPPRVEWRQLRTEFAP